MDNTPLDFRTERAPSEWDTPFLAATRGYDHTLLLNGSGLRPAACVHSPRSGRQLTVWTDLPALQLYTSNYPEPGLPLEGGVPDEVHHTLCLETQYATDFPHYPSFPGKYLLPGEEYSTTTLYRFAVR